MKKKRRSIKRTRVRCILEEKKMRSKKEGQNRIKKKIIGRSENPQKTEKFVIKEKIETILTDPLTKVIGSRKITTTEGIKIPEDTTIITTIATRRTIENKEDRKQGSSENTIMKVIIDPATNPSIETITKKRTIAPGKTRKEWMGNKLNPNIVRKRMNPTTINVEKPRPEELQDTTTPKATSGLRSQTAKTEAPATATLKKMIDLVIKSRLL
jgi:hypothetical protein